MYEVTDSTGERALIGPDTDGLDCVRLQYIDALPPEKSGRERTLADFMVDPVMARKIALALLKAADDADLARRLYGHKS